MHATLPLLRETDFPPIRRGPLQTLQVNLGYKCNQSCLHCHVNAGPTRSEMMDGTTLQMVVAFLQASGVRQLDLTGGAPELHPRFRELVSVARALEVEVIDRCNLTILEEPGQEDLADFLAEHRVGIIASLPCYLEENVENQRGKGVYGASIRGLRRLNALGYGQPDSGLELNLMYNPVGPWLPPPQAGLEADYRRELAEREGVVFNRLYALTNMPIARFGSTLISHDGFEDYMALLKSAHCPDNLNTVMCRSLISVDWQGYVYDCDFNQMLGLALGDDRPTHLSELIGRDLDARPIAVADHCYGCTAGQGSSCGGALGG
ncbi:radical SAM domain protein [Thiohalobacter thiocyanaticus]|uniref:Radical SAM domain protein n=1 Tax=Thiohalobacter thiocyanaticus TaxID=585455 RepID=A0A1Z4VQX4_9GAMM|nr:arsenosugar biosynthesis radical SAM (seleno)protein ArsS [Thiohalobacter thiocyanaticus]BAZ94031.1 radical SAM domain protein [Thiohalobacter thiocyanaticus]